MATDLADYFDNYFEKFIKRIGFKREKLRSYCPSFPLGVSRVTGVMKLLQLSSVELNRSWKSQPQLGELWSRSPM